MFKEVLGGPTTMEGITDTPLSLLHEMRQMVGESITLGLNDDEITSFLDKDAKLAQAIEDAHAALHALES